MRKILAGTLAATLAVAGLTFTSGQNAGAATPPNSQSAGNFLDATAGGKPIDQLLALAFARAQNPGNVTDQNPLDVKVLNTLDLPLTGALQFPQLLGINLGAVNQVANAQSNGRSWGGAGAVANSGGISIGADNNAFPANASIDLNPTALTEDAKVAATNAAVKSAVAVPSLGDVKVNVGAVAANAQTPVGKGSAGSTAYEIAGLDIQADSPLLGSLLSGLGGPVSTLLTTLGNLLSLPGTCPLSSGHLPTLDIAGGTIIIDPLTGSLDISLGKLLTLLGVDINNLPANTDVLQYLLDYLTSPGGLATAIGNLVDSLFDPSVTNSIAYDFVNCAPSALQSTVTALFKSSGVLLQALDTVLGGLKGTGGTSLLAPIATALKGLIDIGMNVQPSGADGTFTSQLNALPKQGMDPPPVPYAHVVRAIEVDVLGNTLDLALANAAAGPSNPAAPPATAPPATSPPATQLPTGVPAGYASGKSRQLPLILLIVGVFLASGGAIAARQRARGRHRAS
jgi:hypothetical protein